MVGSGPCSLASDVRYGRKADVAIDRSPTQRLLALGGKPAPCYNLSSRGKLTVGHRAAERPRAPAYEGRASMDLAFLHHRREVSLLRARFAACAPSRLAHEQLVTAYAVRMDGKVAVPSMYSIGEGWSSAEKADHLREQAASCRRLASVARLPAGAAALRAVAAQFDLDARRMDPLPGVLSGVSQ